MQAKQPPYRFGVLLSSLVTIILVLLLPPVGWGQNTPDVMRVGILHFPPHMILDEQKPPRGFAIDVLEAVATRAGVDVQYVIIPKWSETLQALRDKQIDVISAMGVTAERRQWFAFTAPIEVTSIHLFVREDTITIAGLKDLSGRTVSVVQKNVGARLMQRHRDQHADVELLVHASRDEALLSLLAGQSDALVYPVNVLRQLLQQTGLEDRIKTVGKPLLEIKRALAVRPDRPALLARLDLAVKAFILSPDYQAIFTKWYGRPAPFWTVKKVGLIMGGLLIVTIAALVTWRYRSVVQLNTQLTTAHQFAQSTLDALSAHIAILDETGTVIAVNAAWHQFAQANDFSAGSHGVGVNYLALCDRATDGGAGEAVEVAQGIRLVMAGQRDYFDLEYPCHSPGELRWFMMRCTSFVSPAGPRVVVAHENITSQKQAEQALRESEERFRQIAETIREVFWVTDPLMPQILYVSPAYEAIWARSRESLYTQPMSWLDAIHLEDREVGEVAFERQCRGELTDVEYRILQPDGDTRWIRDRGFPIRDPGGQVYRITGIAEDITARKHSEAQIARQNERLEQAVQETTREMEALMARMVRHEKLAAIGQISGSIAHELRNPLGTVKQSLFFLNLLYKTQRLESTNPKVPEHLQLMDAEIDAAERVISQLLAFARAQPPQPEWLNLQELLDDALPMVQWGEEMQLSTTFDPDSFQFWADRWHMQHILMNLLSNAADACSQKGLVTINAHVDRGTQEYEITVQDTGCGIPADELESVFEPLYTHKAWGTGLGLSLCQQLITQQSGTITLKSRDGQGTTVYLRLPLPPKTDVTLTA